MSKMVIIELDRPREIKFGHKAIKMVEAMLKKPLLDVLRESSAKGFESEDVEKIMFCGLKNDDPELKFEEMENILDKCNNYITILDRMSEAIMETYGISGKKNENSESDKERKK